MNNEGYVRVVVLLASLATFIPSANAAEDGRYLYALPPHDDDPDTDDDLICNYSA